MTLVDTPCGQIQGVISPAQVAVYRGIRFATAKRLEPPVVVTQWPGVFDALSIGAECPQTESQLRQLLNADESGQSEDCLLLNITTPTDSASPRPVYVWIHGGGFTNITPPLSWNESERLTLDGDAVVVTLSYRIGAFGFLGNLNLGILDQIAALQWVQTNISSFVRWWLQCCCSDGSTICNWSVLTSLGDERFSWAITHIRCCAEG